MNINREEKKSIRSAFGKALAEAGRINSNVVVLDADLACSTQTQIFAKEFPERFFDCGIAEQDMVTTAVGLSTTGKIPFASSFAVFATGRAYDQVRNSICYPNFNVKIVGTHGGVTVGEDGASHEALEDISLMRGLPNMSVFVPADCNECAQIIKYASEHKGPMYIRVPRSNVCDVYDENYKFDFNKAQVLQDGTDVTIFTNGETVAEAIEAVNELTKDGYSIGIVSVPVVKPIDAETIINQAKKSKFVITIENHSVIGGLGSAVCEVLSESHPTIVHRIGVNDKFGQTGKAEELLDCYGLSANKLKETIKHYIDKCCEK
mgnify:FL=1